MKVVMLLSNGFAPDPRVAAEALALQGLGHRVTIFCWDRTGQYSADDDYQGIRIKRCQVKTVYSRGPLQIFKFIRFWREISCFLHSQAVDLVHCHDLDTLGPGLAFGKRHGVPVIYDAHESYPDMVAHLFPRPVVWLIRGLEERLVPQVDAVITVGKLLAGHFKAMGARKISIVGNYKTARSHQTEAPGIPPLKIVYVGGLNRDRLIAPMIKAVAGESLFRFTVVGDGPEASRLKELAGSAANIVFTGFLPQEEAGRIISGSHLVYYGIDPEYPNNKYSAPNSLFLALAAGRPVLATAVGEIAHIIEAEGCGSVLPDLSPETIQRTLKEYLNESFRISRSKLACRAFLNEFNWEKAAEQLRSLYQELER